jgi:hypothetical protein
MLKHQMSVILLLGFALCLTGCTDKQLKKANTLMVDYSATIKVAETAVAEGEATTITINGVETPVIPTNAARKLMTVLNQVNTAGQQIKDILAGISKLDAASRDKITSILETTANELDPYKIEEIIGIKNANTKLTVETAFTGIRTVITSITVAVAANGG